MNHTMLPSEIAGIAIPRTPLAAEAEAFARAAMEPYLFNHSVRAFVFAACEFERRGIAYDAEIAFVGALFHDLGLVEAHASAASRFELDGADAAKTFLLERGVADDRAHVAWLAIALHACGEIPLRLQPEIAHLATGTTMDVAGLHVDKIATSRRDAVLQAVPRLDFKNAISAALLTYARRKPIAQLFTFTDAYVRAHAPELALPTLDGVIAAAPFAE